MSGRRTRRAKLTAAAFSYHEEEDSEDESDSSAAEEDSDYDSGGLFDILGFMHTVMRRVSGGRRRRAATSPRKTPVKRRKRAPVQGPCCGQAHCAANMFGRQNADAAGTSSLCSKRRTKKKCSKRSKATAPPPTVSLESDDEVEMADQEKEKIVSKIDNFFKLVESSDDDFEIKFKKETKPATVTKNSDFYTISDDEYEVKKASSREASFSQPNTSEMDSSLNVTQEKEKEKKKEDLFAFVDDLINNCDVHIEDLTKSEENRPVETLDDLKKKTEEILGTVSTLIDGINPEKKKEEKKKSDPPEGPSCPVCFEPFGEDLPRMVTMCGHMFCEPCISQVAKTIKKCPTCRKSVTKQKYHAIYI